MKLRMAAVLGAGLFALAAPSAAPAHFILQQPASWLVESPLGDPQKAGPCGGTTADPGKPTGAVTALTGGQMLHIQVKETVYHPGYPIGADAAFLDGLLKLVAIGTVADVMRPLFGENALLVRRGLPFSAGGMVPAWPPC